MRETTSSRPTRIVTVCVYGSPAQRPAQNEWRFDLLARVIAKLKRKPEWADADAVLLPAGYFRSSLWFGPLIQAERSALLLESDIGMVCTRLASRLHRWSPGCVLVAGIDTNKPNRNFRGDQLMAVFAKGGPQFVSRKIFPVDGDTNDKGRRPIVLFAEDAEPRSRTIELRSDQLGLISVCYDAFVWTELAYPTGKRSALRSLATVNSQIRHPTARERDRVLQRLLSGRRSPVVNLIGIHLFARPGADTYWQRHGISTASAALEGILTVGAAHFVEGLPEDFRRSPLAAFRVPPTQLALSNHRKALPYPPVRGFYLYEDDWPVALVRLYVTD